MKIRKLEIRNFQSHRHTVINFSDGFNCIVGPTRSGKSAIFRALDFLLYNSWVSENVTFGEKESYIKATCDSFVIERWKGEKINKVTVSFPDGKGFTFENFGSTYPDQVKQYLNVSEILVNEKSLPLNTSDQDAPLFILYESGVFKSKLFGQISKTQLVDNIIASINKDRKQIQTNQSLLEAVIESNLSKIIEFDSVIIHRESLESSKPKLLDVKTKASKLELLLGIQEKAKKYLAAVSLLKKKLDFFKSFNEESCNKILEADKKRNLLLERKEKLNRLVTNLSIVSKREKDLDIKEQLILKELSSIKVCPTCGNTVI